MLIQRLAENLLALQKKTNKDELGKRENKNNDRGREVTWNQLLSLRISHLSIVLR